MTGGTTLIIIVAILAFAAIRIAAYNTRGRRAKKDAGASETTAAERKELEELRERIKVLERIATDGNTLDARDARRISAEIDALREQN